MRMLSLLIPAALAACTVETMDSAAPHTVVIAPSATTSFPNPTPVKRKSSVSDSVTTVIKPDGTIITTATKPKPAKAANYTGNWKTQDDLGRTCRITLHGDEGFGERRASGNCFAPRLFNISGWQLRGNEVVLLSGIDGIVARLKMDTDGTLKGDGMTLWR